MKQFLLFFISFSVILPLNVFARIWYPNPAAVYCDKMGYTYITETDSNGAEDGVCILPDSSRVNAWDFFRGTVATNFSYCARYGYSLLRDTVEGYSNVFCPYCVQYDTNGLIVTKIKMTDFMKQNGDTLIPPICYKSDSDNGIKINTQRKNELTKILDLPTEFTWLNFNGHNYVNPIRDQSRNGSCYAFAAVSCAEGVYNYNTGSIDDLKKQFSESFLMWCLGYLNEFKYHFDGMHGAGPGYYELKALTTNGAIYNSHRGIILRDYFQYTMTYPGSCTHWNDPKVIFSGWVQIPANDIDAIKTAIMTNGVVDAAMYSDDTFANDTHDPDGSFIVSDCNYTIDSTWFNHAVSLVGWGYDEQKGDYWLLRNSHGTGWGYNGYIKIKTSSRGISQYVAYLVPNPVSFNDETMLEYNKVPSVGNVIFRAGSEIVLKAGFHLNHTFEVNNGAEFHAYIDNTVPIIFKEKTISNNVEKNDFSESNQLIYGDCNCSIDKKFKSVINSTLTNKVNDYDNCKIFPNPGFDIFYFKYLNNNRPRKVNVFNSLGTLIYQSNDRLIEKIDLTGQTSGLYILRCYFDDFVQNIKVVKY